MNPDGQEVKAVPASSKTPVVLNIKIYNKVRQKSWYFSIRGFG